MWERRNKGQGKRSTQISLQSGFRSRERSYRISDQGHGEKRVISDVSV